MDEIQQEYMEKAASNAKPVEVTVRGALEELYASLSETAATIEMVESALQPVLRNTDTAVNLQPNGGVPSDDSEMVRHITDMLILSRRNIDGLHSIGRRIQV